MNMNYMSFLDIPGMMNMMSSKYLSPTILFGLSKGAPNPKSVRYTIITFRIQGSHYLHVLTRSQLNTHIIPSGILINEFHEFPLSTKVAKTDLYSYTCDFYPYEYGLTFAEWSLQKPRIFQVFVHVFLRVPGTLSTAAFHQSGCAVLRSVSNPSGI